MGPLPANATMFCDKSTGSWLPNVSSSGAPRANSIQVEFDRLGKEPYVPLNPAIAILPKSLREKRQH